MRKKVLILTPFYPPNIGGAETYAQALVTEACKKHDIDVLTYMPFRGDAPIFEMINGVRIYRIKWPFRPPAVWKGTTLRNFLLVVPKLLWHAFIMTRGMRYRTVHAQGLLCCLIGIILKKVFRVKLLVTTLALYGFKSKTALMARVVAYALNQADKIFVEGETGRNDLLSIGVRDELMVKFMHWVDLEVFKPSLRKQSNIRVLFVGRPIPEKGIEVVTWLQRHFRQTCDKKIYYQIAENVRYEELLRLYKHADILIVPSLYEEGFTRVIVEAAACGCAIIASCKGALPELMDCGSLGIITRPTGQEFVHNIGLLAANPTLLADAKKKARRYAEKHFSPKNAEVMIENY